MSIGKRHFKSRLERVLSFNDFTRQLNRKIYRHIDNIIDTCMLSIVTRELVRPCKLPAAIVPIALVGLLAGVRTKVLLQV